MDAILDKSGHGLFSEHVPANTSDECDVAARAGRGHRLVGAFATGGRDKLTAQDGLARLRNAVELDDHVGI